MSYKIIKDLVEKFSCELILADGQEPKSLSVLLPILKNIHSHCLHLLLISQAKEIRTARNLINKSIKNNSKNITEQITALETLISDFSKSLQGSDQDEQISGTTEKQSSGNGTDPVSDYFEQLENKLDGFGLMISEFCPGEIPDLDAMLNSLDDLIEISKEIEPSTFHQISIACKGYVETMTLENISNTRPIEEGLLLLKSILNHFKRKEPFAPESISDDDMEILVDFVSEAEENLDTIEVNLMDLEQDPSNRDIINDIFRPFHTIKGVSGFLALTKINLPMPRKISWTVP